MAKVLMLPLPTYGHIHPTLPLAQELVARGEEVCYCLPEEFKPTIAWTGAACVPYQLSGRGFRWRRLSCEELFFWQPLHMAVFSLEALPQLLEVVPGWRPDYLLYDASCLWGRLLGHLLHLPAIRFNTTFVLNEQLGPGFWTLLDQAERVSMPRLAIRAGEEGEITFQSAVEQLCSIYPLHPIELKSFFDHAERLNLVPIPPAFQPGVEHFDERFLFPGPMIGSRPEASDFPFVQLQAQPTLYISMGSVCHHEVEFFKTCFAAFGRTQGPTKRQGWPAHASRRSGKRKWQVILASGTSDPARLGPVPENFLVRPSVPQLALLQQTTVFVTHGGMNSVLEALSFGVPLVVIPQMAEQVITARRVEELGLGIALEKSAVTGEALADAVTEVANDQELHTRVHQMRDALRQMGGARSAVDAILRFSRTEGQKGWSWASRVEPRSPRPKVFGIGLSRTGTTSLTEALKLLGYRTLHWPADLVTQVEVYRFFATGEADLHLSLLKDLDALTDTPVCCLYQALDKAYPGSKFILTVREKQAWLESYESHWRRHPSLFSERPDGLVAHYSHFLNERLYGTQSADPEILSPAYDRYTAEVLEYFRERPQDLLVLDICGGDGWSKLAPFLDVATPEVSFPWENQARNTMAPDNRKREMSDTTQWQPQEASWRARVEPRSSTSKEKTGMECISVVIPTYNRREVLVKTLAAFANQDLPLEYEVLVCDDGSSDETAEVVTRMIKESRFTLRYLRHERVGFRLAATRNMGIAAAKGSLIVFTDDDIIPSPSYLSAHYEAHHTPRTVVIGYRYALLPDQERGCTMLGQDVRDKEFAAFPDLRGPLWMLMYGCNFSVEHALLDEVGVFDEHFEGWGAEDLELAYRLVRSGARFVLEKKAYGWHQPDPGPVSPPMTGAEVVPPNVISHLTNLSRFRSKYPEDPGLQQILSRLIVGLEQERNRILAGNAV